MPQRPFEQVRPGNPLSASELTRLQGLAQSAADMTGSAATSVRMGVGGLVLQDTAPREIWAKLMSFDAAKKGYTWQGLEEMGDGTFFDGSLRSLAIDNNPLPAYEPNGNKDLCAGGKTPIVRMRPGGPGDYFEILTSVGGTPLQVSRIDHADEPDTPDRHTQGSNNVGAVILAPKDLWDVVPYKLQSTDPNTHVQANLKMRKATIRVKSYSCAGNNLVESYTDYDVIVPS